MYKLYRQKIKGGIAVDEIKVGEYVRTKDGVIAKVTDVLEEYCIDCNDDVFDLNIGPMMEIPWEYIEEYIVNHSFNIKELIEEGDIVEYQVNSLSKLKVGRVNSYRDTRSNKECLCVEGFDITKIAKIRTILTHEQYERNYYRLENN